MVRLKTFSLVLLFDYSLLTKNDIFSNPPTTTKCHTLPFLGELPSANLTKK